MARIPSRAARRRSSLLAAVAAFGVFALSAAPAMAARCTAHPAASAATAGIDQPLFGVHTDHDPYMGNVRNVDRLQNRLRRPISIVNWYQMWGGDDWTNKVHPDVVGAVTGSGRIPLITWQPSAIGNGSEWQPEYRLRRIARGRFDPMIRDWADSLRALRSTVYLRPMHEMNGNWYPWSATVNGNSTAQFRAAWRRVWRIFHRRGADNVCFVWSPLTVDVPAIPTNRMERYYPGDRYVDVLALDGYNWGADAPDGAGWRSFRSIFEAAYRRIAKIGPQPIWIAEVATADTGGDKAAWVRDMWRTASRWRRLKAIVWFDIDKERDWRADATARIANAFRPPSPFRPPPR
jgi:beta-mannanase